MKFNKIFLTIIFILMALGFKAFNYTWSISESDPTVWVKACDAIKTKTFTNDITDVYDPLYGSGGTVTGATVLASVFTDYINVNSSYVRLAAYPTDPDNPGTPATGDSTFTKAKAENRTIEICTSDPGALKGGYASYQVKNNSISKCTIVLKDYSDLKRFLEVVTHEIGHCMGLDHPMETTNALMSYFRKSGAYRLMMDDKMGVAYLYPKSGVELKEDNTFGLQCSLK